MAQIVKLDRSGAALRKAALVLAEGGLVGLPTQTFYALAARADRAEAIARVFELKGREQGKPFLLLVGGVRDLPRYARRVPELAARLGNAFWPGPLTMILPAVGGLNPLLVGPGGGVALRVEGLGAARELAQLTGAGLTGTSLNPSGAAPAVSAAQAARYLGGQVELILDLGQDCAGGPPSTLLDLTVNPPRIVRPGAVAASQIQALAPEVREGEA